MQVTQDKLAQLDHEYLGADRATAVNFLLGQRFEYRWQLAGALAVASEAWQAREDSNLTRNYNKQLQANLDYLYRHLHDQPGGA